MPRERPQPPPFEEAWLQRSLDRYLGAGLVFMLVLIAGFVAYRVREPHLRHVAAQQQAVAYQNLGAQLFASNCAQCHGPHGDGVGSAPTLHALEFLKSTSDNQIRALTSGGISGSSMPAWSLDFGGTMTDEQINAIIVYLRSMEHNAPSVPGWRKGDAIPGTAK